MDFEGWQCRNLARTVLSRAYRQSIRRYKEYNDNKNKNDIDSTASEDFIPKQDVKQNRSKKKTVRIEHGHRVAIYRRFDRNRQNSDSSDSVQSDKSSFPIYRRFSRGISDDPFEVNWPLSQFMTPLTGKRAIIDFIDKKWRYNRNIHYVVEYMNCVQLQEVKKYKYCSNWSNGFTSCRVYFTLDASTDDPSRPVEMRYFMPDGQRAHRPSSTGEHFNRFIRYLNTQQSCKN